MRTREEIMTRASEVTGAHDHHRLILETLLDIRDLLNKPPVDIVSYSPGYRAFNGIPPQPHEENH